MSDATYELSVDLDRSGIFDVDEDLIGDVMPVLSTERGHDLTRVLSPPIAGAMNFVLNNQSGAYSPGGDLRGGREARLRATHNGTKYDVWRGFLDHPRQTPPGSTIKFTTVQCFGHLARLVGRTVSSELYEQITTGAAIGHLLDGAGYSKNLQGYLDDLLPAAGWNLASTSGNDPDTSGNGNNAVLTLGSGVRGSAAIDDSGTATTEFDGAATKYTVTDAAPLLNIFAGGGLVLCAFNADTDGEGDVGTLVGKTGWRLYVADESASAMRVRFFRDHATTDGLWETTSRVITVGKDYLVAVFHDDTNVANNPTMWLYDIDGETLTTLTVGSGLTESTSPGGAAVSDTTNAVVIGNVAGNNQTFDGNIGTVRFYTTGTAVSWGALIPFITDRSTFAPRHIDSGETTLEWWWLDNEDALAALETLKNSEGPGAGLYEDPTGAIVFKGRHARSTEARSTTVQTTFNSGAGAEPRIGLPFEYDDGVKDLVNICEINVVRRAAQSLAEVWALGENVSFAAGETKQFVASSSDPFKAAVAPTSGGGDYTVVSGSISAPTIDRTSGAQVTITITSAAGATISGLRLRAQAVTVVNSSRAVNTIDTTASQSEFGAKTYRLPVRQEIGFNLAQDFCNAIVGFYQNGRPTSSITLDDNVADTRMVAALAREVGDRVRVVVGSELDEEMYVEHVRQDMLAAMWQRTIFDLTVAQGVISYFTLDSSVLDGVDVLAF